MIDVLLQAAPPELSVRFVDVIQYLTAAGVAGCATFLWRLKGEVAEIRTILGHPELGVTPTIAALRKSRHHDASTLQAHETRLDGHDRDIARIDGAIERRATPQKPTALDRRSST